MRVSAGGERSYRCRAMLIYLCSNSTLITNRQTLYLHFDQISYAFMLQYNRITDRNINTQFLLLLWHTTTTGVPNGFGYWLPTRVYTINLHICVLLVRFCKFTKFYCCVQKSDDCRHIAVDQ